MSNIIGPVVTHLLGAQSFPPLSKAAAPAPGAFDSVLTDTHISAFYSVHDCYTGNMDIKDKCAVRLRVQS